mmetsp:Transcript_64650/g.114996  ORF Transcript_64650/g.114996 Transcript_64650/m.114996 type:complete len:417 (+) Transcript_64650:105-1355(+)
MLGGMGFPGGFPNPNGVAGGVPTQQNFVAQPFAGFQQVQYGQYGAAPAGVQPTLVQQPATGFDFSSSLVAALQSHMPSASPAPVQPQPVQSPPAVDGLQALLMNSLASFSSEPAPSGGSTATQDLLRLVQDRIKAEPGVKAEPGLVKAEPGVAAPVAPQPVRPVQPLPAPTQAVKTESGVTEQPRKKQRTAVKTEPVKAEPGDDDDVQIMGTKPAPGKPRLVKSEANIGDQAPRSKVEEDDDESDDGMPHRLPPGFGAIPEDIVEERQRQREEERMLQLKATQPCRFGKRCKKRDCPNAHPEGRDIDSEINPCAFGRRCKRQGCFYDHPEGRMIDQDPTKGQCKFGAACARADCLYSHPEGRVAIAGLEPKVCFFCHGDGHIATECPRNPESWCYDRTAAMRAAAQAGEVKALTNG